MSDQVMLSLVMSECKHAVEACNGDVRDKLRAAMNVAKDHWMVLDKDIQFRGAIGAVMTHYGVESAEFKRISAELDTIRKFSAFLNAAQCGLSVTPPELEEQQEPLGMMGMWREVTKP